jgi:multiple sugar transport system permease protein
MSPSKRREFTLGLMFISPWLVGFVIFFLWPIGQAIRFSLADYSVLADPVYIGLENYRLLAADELFWKALINTVVFAMMAVPTGLAVALALALLLNFNLPGRNLFRTLFFLPSLLPLVCLGVLWQWLLNGDIGLVNTFIRPLTDTVNALVGTDLSPPNWLMEPAWTKPGLVIAGAWTAGNAMVIFLAGLQDVPRHLYEAAEIDGAGPGLRFRYVTLPMISPVLYFNGIMAIIGSFQVFAMPFVLAVGGDGPDRSLLFLTTYVYRSAFEYWDMGYASAIGLVLFVVVLLVTLLAHRFGQSFVYYEGK